jgi:hypothetical protein
MCSNFTSITFHKIALVKNATKCLFLLIQGEKDSVIGELAKKIQHTAFLSQGTQKLIDICLYYILQFR